VLKGDNNEGECRRPGEEEAHCGPALVEGCVGAGMVLVRSVQPCGLSKRTSRSGPHEQICDSSVWRADAGHD